MQIETANTEFAALAQKEVDGTLTVAEREAYLSNKLRVPHLVQLVPTSSQLVGDWVESDPQQQFGRHESDGPLVRECPSENHSYGGHIQSCFGYVNINLHRYTGRSAGIGHLPPTHLGLETYRELKRSGDPANLVYEMMVQVAIQAEFRQRAEEIVASLPAQQVSAGFVERRVKTEYDKLRCER